MDMLDGGPIRFTLGKKDVHVWHLGLGAPGPIILNGLHAILSDEERRRAEKFQFEKNRLPYIVAHAALRRILAGYLKVDPSELTFREGPYGKPELILTWQRETLNFNLSHSHEAALIGVTLGRQIGVDVEFIKKDFKWQEIAERFFAPGEIASLRALPQEKQRRAFFTCWTRKEAYIKAKGGGLSIPLQDFEVSLEEPAAILTHQSDPEEVKRWALSEIEVSADYAAAVAVEGQGWRLQCRRWPSDWN
jgi:4'-phosphopantetheinyl transferase